MTPVTSSFSHCLSEVLWGLCESRVVAVWIPRNAVGNSKKKFQKFWWKFFSDGPAADCKRSYYFLERFLATAILGIKGYLRGSMLTDEKLDEIGDKLDTSSGKSLVCLAQLSGMSVSSVWDATKEQQFIKCDTLWIKTEFCGLVPSSRCVLRNRFFCVTGGAWFHPVGCMNS